MIAVLETIAATVAAAGQTTLWAIITAANVMFAAIGAVVAAAFGLLPGMSSAPSLGAPSWLQWLNWFLPIGDLIAGLTALVTVWVAYLAVRYILRVARAI